MRRERMIPPFPSHGRTRPAFSCGIPPNVLFPRTSALLRNRPAKAAKSRVFPCNSASAPHEAAYHGNGLFPCAWELTHGCPWLRSTAFHVHVRAGTPQRQKAERSENKGFPRVGARCHAQRLSPLHNKDSRLRGAQGSCATPARGRKLAFPRKSSPTDARKLCLQRPFFPARSRALYELASHNGRAQRSRLRFRKNAVSLPKT